jgi:hypothetical protein
MRKIVATTDTTKEPTQPRRLEKNANTAEQLLKLTARAGEINTPAASAGCAVTVVPFSTHQTRKPEQTC